MIHKLFHARPVMAHVAKVSLFLVIQAGLWLGLRAGIDPPVETAAPDHTEAFLREELYARWQGDHRLLKDITNPIRKRHPVLERLSYYYTAGPDAYLAAVKDKERLLKETPGPRLICVGGSGLAFGLDSKLLAERYAYHPINLGLHAGLGGDFMLRWAGANARRGDVVILCLEAPVLSWDFTMTPERKKSLLRIAPEMAKYIEPASTAEVTWREWLDEYKTYADEEALAATASKVRARLGHGWNQLLPRDLSETEQFEHAFSARRDELMELFEQAPGIVNREYPRICYCRSAGNEFGDMIEHRGLPRPAKCADGLNLNDHPNLKDKEVSQQIATNLQRLNLFAKDCEAEGVRVYFAYPPLIDGPKARAFAPGYRAMVERHLDIPILNDAEEMILAEELFFDSPHHLTWRGTCVRMRNWISGLDRYLEPEVPMSPARHVASRDSAVRARIVAAGPTDSAVH